MNGTNKIKEALSEARKESRSSDPDPDRVLCYCEKYERYITQLNPTEKAELERLKRSAEILLAKEHWDMATDKNDEPCSRSSALEICKIYLVDLAEVSFSALRTTKAEFEKLEQYLEEECSKQGGVEWE